MKPIKNLISVVVLSLVCISCSDTWDSHYDAQSGSSDQTLWQQMSADSDLSNFCSVLSNTYVFRHHKKSSVSYSDLLNSGQSFTVYAPINGTFNQDSLITLCQTAVGDSMVERMFVKNHISRSPISLFKDSSSDILLINSKHLTLGDGKIGDVTISSANNHAKNGILHIIESQLPFKYNVYEALKNVAEYDSIGNFLKSFEKDSLDEENSLSSGLVDGLPVYIDSVIIEKNSLLDGFGYINSEDSSYWMVVPSAAGFIKAYDDVSQYFNYAYISKADSLQRYWTYRALLDDAIFNLNVQGSPNDSLISTRYKAKYPDRHVFYKPFSSGGILSNVSKEINCSNGILYQTDEWPFTTQGTFFREIITEGEKEANIQSYSSCSYNVRTLSADSISENSYMDIVPSSGTSNWNVAYSISNTLSGTYDICLIDLPKSVYNQVSPDTRPNKFKVSLKYYNEQGKLMTYSFGNTEYTNDPAIVDTIVLAKAFKFPTCNYSQENSTVTLTITCSILARQTSTYSREMYLDCIYLKPTSEEK